MHFASIPPQECSSKDVFDLLTTDEERIEINNQLRITNRLFQINLENGFLQVPIVPKEPVILEPQDELVWD